MSEKFKRGDKVVCIEAPLYGGEIVLHGIYEVDSYYVQDLVFLKNSLKAWFDHRFELVEE